jgi:hypothetical protein
MSSEASASGASVSAWLLPGAQLAGLVAAAGGAPPSAEEVVARGRVMPAAASELRLGPGMLRLVGIGWGAGGLPWDEDGSFGSGLLCHALWGSGFEGGVDPTSGRECSDPTLAPSKFVKQRNPFAVRPGRAILLCPVVSC